MFIRVLFLLTITSWFYVDCYVPVPPIYRKIQEALRRYSSSSTHNPVIYSLLNVLVYDKRAKAFISNKAIELSLEDIKKYNKNDEQVLRRIIYGKKTSAKFNKPSSNLKEKITSALDTYFSHPNTDDYQTSHLLSAKTKSENY